MKNSSKLLGRFVCVFLCIVFMQVQAVWAEEIECFSSKFDVLKANIVKPNNDKYFFSMTTTPMFNTALSAFSINQYIGGEIIYPGVDMSQLQLLSNDNFTIDIKQIDVGQLSKNAASELFDFAISPLINVVSYNGIDFGAINTLNNVINIIADPYGLLRGQNYYSMTIKAFGPEIPSSFVSDRMNISSTYDDGALNIIKNEHKMIKTNFNTKFKDPAKIGVRGYSPVMDSRSTLINTRTTIRTQYNGHRFNNTNYNSSMLR